MPTPTMGSIAASQTSQLFLQVNSQRSEAIVQNASTGALYVGLGVAPSPQAYSAKLYTDDVLTTAFKGQIFGTFATTNGSAMVTEVS